MTFDAKRAPGDIALNDATAKENIEPLTVQAQDYSGAIQQEQHRSAVAADVFVPLIDMEEKGIEVNETEKQAQWAIDFNKDKITDEEYRNAYETLTKANIVNSIYDANLRMMDQWFIKKQFALEQGINEVDALEELVQEYTPEKLFPNSQMAREMWDTNMYKPFYSQTRAESIQNDLKTAQTKTLNALSNSVNIAVADIYNGKSSDEAFAGWMRQTALQRSTLSLNDNNRAINETYSNLKFAEAKMLYNTANPSNYSKIKNVLKGMLKDNGKKQFQALDENGNPLKDVKLDLVIDAQHTEAISGMIGSLDDKARAASGGGGVGSAAVGSLLNDLNAKYGGATALEKGIEKKDVMALGSYTREQIDNDFKTVRNTIENSNLSPSAKAASLDKLTRQYGAVILQHEQGVAWLEGSKNLAEAIGRIKSGSATPADYIKAGANVLQNTPVGKAIAGFKTNQEMSRLRNKINQIMQSSSAPDITHLVSKDYRDNIGKGVNSIKAGNVEGAIQHFKLAGNAADGFTGTKNSTASKVLPSHIMSDLAEHYKSLNPEDKEKFSKNFATVLVKSGMVSTLVDSSYLKNIENNKEAVAFSKNVFKNVIYEKANPELDAAVFNCEHKNATQEQLNQSYSGYIANLPDSTNSHYKSTDSIGGYAETLCKKYKIDRSMISLVSGLIEDATKKLIFSDPNIKQENIDKAIESTLQNNFIDIKSKYAGESYFVYDLDRYGQVSNDTIEWEKTKVEAAGYAAERACHEYTGLRGIRKITLHKNASGDYEVSGDGKPLRYMDPILKQQKVLTIQNYDNIIGFSNLSKPMQEKQIASHAHGLTLAYIIATDDAAARKIVKDVSTSGWNKFVDDSKIGEAYFGQGFNKNDAKSIRVNQERLQSEAAKILYTMTEEGFAQEMVDYLSDDNLKYEMIDKLGMNPIFKVLDHGTVQIGDNTVANFAYNRAIAAGTINTVINKEEQYSATRGDTAYFDTVSKAKSKGFQLDVLGKKNKDNYNYKFIIGYHPHLTRGKIDIWGKWTSEAVTDMRQIVMETRDHNRFETSDVRLYENLKDIKNSQGKPVVKLVRSGFFEGDSSARGLKVISLPPDQNSITNTPEQKARIHAKDAYNNQSNGMPKLGQKDIDAVLMATYSDMDKDSDGRFGMARLTEEQYQSYGITKDQMRKNPFIQDRILINRIQSLAVKTGSIDMAIQLTLGGKVKIYTSDSTNGGRTDESKSYNAEQVLLMPNLKANQYLVMHDIYNVDKDKHYTKKEANEYLERVRKYNDHKRSMSNL